jgi:hypothetical protein
MSPARFDATIGAHCANYYDGSGTLAGSLVSWRVLGRWIEVARTLAAAE